VRGQPFVGDPEATLAVGAVGFGLGQRSADVILVGVGPVNPVFLVVDVFFGFCARFVGASKQAAGSRSAR
jgi:hypothetical protein